jgi:hypothetical protein
MTLGRMRGEKHRNESLIAARGASHRNAEDIREPASDRVRGRGPLAELRAGGGSQAPSKGSGGSTPHPAEPRGVSRSRPSVAGVFLVEPTGIEPPTS